MNMPYSKESLIPLSHDIGLTDLSGDDVGHGDDGLFSQQQHAVHFTFHHVHAQLRDQRRTLGLFNHVISTFMKKNT